MRCTGAWVRQFIALKCVALQNSFEIISIDWPIWLWCWMRRAYNAKRKHLNVRTLSRTKAFKNVHASKIIVQQSNRMWLSCVSIVTNQMVRTHTSAIISRPNPNAPISNYKCVFGKCCVLFAFFIAYSSDVFMR